MFYRAFQQVTPRLSFQNPGGRQALPAAFGSEDALAKGVERVDPELAVRPVELVDDARLHLTRGFVREGQRQDITDLEIIPLDEVGKASCQRGRFASAGPGDDAQRAAVVVNGASLLGGKGQIVFGFQAILSPVPE
jgi:hypothetical protein